MDKLLAHKLVHVLVVLTTAIANAEQHDGTATELLQIFTAKNLEFGFRSEYERQAALSEGLYNPDSTIPIDVQPYYAATHKEPIIFVTIPRFGKGVPYSLAYLTNIVKPNGTELQAYPNYDWHKSHGKDCNGLTSVYRTQIDACNRLWVLDSGEIEFVQHCAPQILAFDLKTGKLAHRYRLPQFTFKTNTSRFVTPIVDVHDRPPYGDCAETFVYMADSIGHGIVVYDMQQGKSWRIENKYTYPNQDFGTFTIAGESFELWDGVIGFALTPAQLSRNRMLYFHALSNNMQISIPLDVVNNASLWQPNDISAALSEFQVLGKRRTQCISTAISREGYYLCGLAASSSITAWNIRLPFTAANIREVAANEETLQFVSGMKIVLNNEYKEEVWVLSNRLQKAFGGTIKYNEINYRIQKCALQALLEGSKCAT